MSPRLGRGAAGGGTFSLLDGTLGTPEREPAHAVRGDGREHSLARCRRRRFLPSFGTTLGALLVKLEPFQPFLRAETPPRNGSRAVNRRVVPAFAPPPHHHGVRVVGIDRDEMIAPC